MGYLCPICRLGGCPVTLREGIFGVHGATVCVGVRGGARAPSGAPAIASVTRWFATVFVRCGLARCFCTLAARRSVRSLLFLFCLFRAVIGRYCMLTCVGRYCRVGLVLSLFYSVVDEVVMEELHDWIDRGFTIVDST